MKSPINRGFTLIELLVVIAIIGLLSSVVLASLNTARSKGRDAKRVSDLHSIQLALELYFDKYGTYPQTTPVCNPGLNDHNDAWCRDSRYNDGATQIANWIPGLNEFLPTMPHNTKPYAGYWPYHYYSPGPNQYWLMVGLENTTSATCGGGSVFIWFDGSSNTCDWWGNGLYVKMVK